MSSLTLKSARKILGKDAADVSDKELENDIEVATLLKDLFFNKLLEKRNDNNKTFVNVP